MAAHGTEQQGVPFDMSVFILFLYPQTFANNPRSVCFDLLGRKQIRKTMFSAVYFPHVVWLQDTNPMGF